MRIVRTLIAVVRPALPSLRDLHVYGGGLLLAVGAGMAWRPGAPLVLGAMLVFLGLYAGRR